MKRYVSLNKEYKELTEVVNTYNSYKDVLDNIENAKSILQTETDAEFKVMAEKSWRNFSVLRSI